MRVVAVEAGTVVAHCLPHLSLELPAGREPVCVLDRWSSINPRSHQQPGGCRWRNVADW